MNRVYLNALGIISALGNGKEETLSKLVAGNRRGVFLHKGLLASGQDLEFGACTDPLAKIPDAFQALASRNSRLALTALAQIRTEIDSCASQYGKDRIGVVIGTSTSGIEEGEKALLYLREHRRFPKSYHFMQQEMGAPSDLIARVLGLQGPAMSLSTACSSSAKTFGTAKRMLDQNLCDAVVVGGVDSFCQLTINGFSSLSALHNGAGCLPFSKNRSGTVLGEGAAIFLMSREPGGCLFASVGESSDAYNMTSPDPAGAGAKAAMASALEEAGVSWEDIAYINLHGTGTTQNDAMEAQAVYDVFGEAPPPISSTKPLSGHTLGAAGAIEAGFCWLTLCPLNNKRLLPVHAWDDEKDPNVPLNTFVKKGDSLPARGMRWCMSNSYAFGGSNASVILGREAG
jgi:3-oxoacyl-[acyl-carrier-protein] synthase I